MLRAVKKTEWSDGIVRVNRYARIAAMVCTISCYDVWIERYLLTHLRGEAVTVAEMNEHNIVEMGYCGHV